MPSSRRTTDLRRRTYLALVSRVESQLRELFAKRCEQDGLSQAALADKLGVNRSVIHRRLTGRSNMTLETLADMAWGVGGCIDLDIYDPAERPQENHALASGTRAAWAPMPTSMLIRPSADARMQGDVRSAAEGIRQGTWVREAAA